MKNIEFLAELRQVRKLICVISKKFLGRSQKHLLNIKSQILLKIQKFLGGPSFFTYPQGGHLFFDGLSEGPRINLTPSVGGPGFI